MKARYHKFTGDIPVVFVEDAMKFMKGLGVTVNENDQPYGQPAFMQEVTMGGLKMLVFSEGIMRTLYGGVKTSMVEAHLALWAGKQKYPTNEVRAYKYALALTERYGRTRTYELLRRKLSEDHSVNVREARPPHANNPKKSIEDHLFTEHQKAASDQIIEESLSLSDIKKKVQDLIKQADEDIIRKVFSLLNRSDDSYAQTIAFMTKIGIPERYAKDILNYATETGDFEVLAKYLKNRTLTLNDLKSSGNFATSVKKKLKGVSDTFVNWLITYKWPTSPSMGSGEVAMVLLLKGGNKPTKGDVGIGNKELEVKGANGRIKGQRGYGAGIAGGMSFEKDFKEYMKKLPAVKRIDIPKAGGSEYQITKKQAFPNKWMEHLSSNGVLTQAQAVKIWQRAIQSLFYDMDVKWVKKHVSKTGAINNVTAFHKDWLSAALNYYHSIEKFDSLALIADNGKMAVLMPSDFKNAWDLVKVTGVPSFTSGAGPQGPTYGISVK